MFLDTNIVSATRKPRRYPEIAAWVAAQAAGSLLLPGPVVAELSYGVHLVQEPLSRRMHDAWLRAIIGTYQVAPLDAEAFVIYGQMLACPALTRFRITPPGAKRAKLAGDLQIAAVSVACSEVLATLNIADFRAIQAEFPALQLLELTPA